MTSVYSTPRNPNLPTRGYDVGEVNDSQIDLLSNGDLSSPGAGRTGYYEGRMNS